MSFQKVLVAGVIFIMAFTAAVNAANYTVPALYNDPVMGWWWLPDINTTLAYIQSGILTEPGPHTITLAGNMSENVMLFGETASPNEADITIDGGFFMLTGSIDCTANTTNVTITNFFPINNGAFGVNCGTNTTVVGNEINNCGNGVECHGTNATVTNNVITLNNNGVQSDTSDSSTISANDIISNTVGVFVDSAAPSITGNTSIDQNTTYGIHITGTGAPTISGNTIDSNDQAGIFNDGTGTVSITGNTITNNGNIIPGYGVYFINGTASISGGNTITGNGSSGIETTGGVMIEALAVGDIEGNTINTNLGSGICFFGSTDGSHTINNNTVANNNDYGLFYQVIASSDGSAITNNSFNNNGASPVTPDQTDMGVFVDDGTPNCHGNTITGNAGEGVFVTDANDANPDFGGGAHSSIGNNTINGNDSSDDSYDFYNANSNNIYAKNNNWGITTDGQMSGNYYNTTDIDPAIYDNWENGSLGYVRWSDPNPLGIKSASLGEIKAVFSGIGGGAATTAPENVLRAIKAK